MAISSNPFENSLSGLGGYDPRTAQYLIEEQMRFMKNQAAAQQKVRVPTPDPSTNPVLLLTGEDE